MSTQVKPKVIFALDIETSGSNLIKNGILAIGYCFGDLNGNIIRKKRINMALDKNHTFEQRCMDQFWSKHMDKLEILSKNTQSPKDGINQFIEDIDTLEDTYDLKIITDNPSFDISFINYYLNYYLDRMPLNYTKNNSYRQIFDIDSYSRGVIKANYNMSWLDDQTLIDKFSLYIDKSTHDHLPENDAAYIYNFHVNLINKISID